MNNKFVIKLFFYRPKKTQSKLLAGAIVVKRTCDENTNPLKKQKLITDETKTSPEKSKGLIILYTF